MGQSFATAINFLVAFIVGQSFLATLCAMRWGSFLFYAAFVAAAIVFAAFCMAETKVTSQTPQSAAFDMRLATFCVSWLPALLQDT